MSSQSFDFYAARAMEAAAEAKSATLDNVRDRALRSQATWTALATQARNVSLRRAKLEREKALARDDAELAIATAAAAAV